MWTSSKSSSACTVQKLIFVIWNVWSWVKVKHVRYNPSFIFFLFAPPKKAQCLVSLVGSVSVPYLDVTIVCYPVDGPLTVKTECYYHVTIWSDQWCGHSIWIVDSNQALEQLSYSVMNNTLIFFLVLNHGLLTRNKNRSILKSYQHRLAMKDYFLYSSPYCHLGLSNR